MQSVNYTSSNNCSSDEKTEERKLPCAQGGDCLCTRSLLSSLLLHCCSNRFINVFIKLFDFTAQQIELANEPALASLGKPGGEVSAAGSQGLRSALRRLDASSQCTLIHITKNSESCRCASDRHVPRAQLLQCVQEQSGSEVADVERLISSSDQHSIGIGEPSLYAPSRLLIMTLTLTTFGFSAMIQLLYPSAAARSEDDVVHWRIRVASLRCDDLRLGSLARASCSHWTRQETSRCNSTPAGCTALVGAGACMSCCRCSSGSGGSDANMAGCAPAKRAKAESKSERND